MELDKFTVGREETDAAYTLRLQGELDLASAPDFRAVTEPLVQDESKRLVLDMKDLRYIDSTGMGILIAILKLRKDNGGAIEFVGIPAKIKRLFDMTGITKFLNDSNPTS